MRLEWKRYIRSKHLKHKLNIVNGVSICMYFTKCALLLYNYIPVSDGVCEGSCGSCTGMRSLDGALEV